jgi:hypothetical protein
MPSSEERGEEDGRAEDEEAKIMGRHTTRILMPVLLRIARSARWLRTGKRLLWISAAAGCVLVLLSAAFLSRTETLGIAAGAALVVSIVSAMLAFRVQ